MAAVRKSLERREVEGGGGGEGEGGEKLIRAVSFAENVEVNASFLLPQEAGERAAAEAAAEAEAGETWVNAARASIDDSLRVKMLQQFIETSEFLSFTHSPGNEGDPDGSPEGGGGGGGARGVGAAVGAGGGGGVGRGDAACATWCSEETRFVLYLQTTHAQRSKIHREVVKWYKTHMSLNSLALRGFEGNLSYDIAHHCMAFDDIPNARRFLADAATFEMECSNWDTGLQYLAFAADLLDQDEEGEDEGEGGDTGEGGGVAVQCNTSARRLSLNDGEDAATLLSPVAHEVRLHLLFGKCFVHLERWDRALVSLEAATYAYTRWAALEQKQVEPSVSSSGDDDDTMEKKSGGGACGAAMQVVDEAKGGEDAGRGEGGNVRSGSRTRRYNSLNEPPPAKRKWRFNPFAWLCRPRTNGESRARLTGASAAKGGNSANSVSGISMESGSGSGNGSCSGSGIGLELEEIDASGSVVVASAAEDGDNACNAGTMCGDVVKSHGEEALRLMEQVQSLVELQEKVKNACAL
jgi:hypothetical protein